MTTTLDPTPPPPDAPGPAGPPGVPRWVIGAFLLGGLVFVAIAVVFLARGEDPDPAAPSEWAGVVLGPDNVRPDFTLTDTSGASFDFAAETGGQLTLVFFGYTNCPDVCPVHMATIAQALDRIDTPVRVVFVTTDPERDTPERIRTWLDSFDRDFVGLTGSLPEVEAAQTAMGASVAIREPAGGGGDYLVGHTSGVFVVTPDDHVRLMYPFGTRQEDWVRDLPRIAAQDQWQAARGEG